MVVDVVSYCFCSADVADVDGVTYCFCSAGIVVVAGAVAGTVAGTVAGVGAGAGADAAIADILAVRIQISFDDSRVVAGEIDDIVTILCCCRMLLL